MCFACILHGLLRDILRGMKKEKVAADPTPKGAKLEKVEVWMPVEMKRQLEAVSIKENRSTNKQAVHFIQLGVEGTNLSALARKVDAMEAMLAELLRRSERG